MDPSGYCATNPDAARFVAVPLIRSTKGPTTPYVPSVYTLVPCNREVTAQTAVPGPSPLHRMSRSPLPGRRASTGLHGLSPGAGCHWQCPARQWPYHYIRLLFRASSREPQNSEVHPVLIHQLRYQPALRLLRGLNQLQDRSDSRRPVLLHSLEGWRVCLSQYLRALRAAQMQFHPMHSSHPIRLVPLCQSALSYHR